MAKLFTVDSEKRHLRYATGVRVLGVGLTPNIIASFSVVRMTGLYAVGPGRILGKTKVFMHLNLKCALNAFAVNATHVVRNETLSCLYSGCRQ